MFIVYQRCLWHARRRCCRPCCTLHGRHLSCSKWRWLWWYRSRDLDKGNNLFPAHLFTFLIVCVDSSGWSGGGTATAGCFIWSISFSSNGLGRLIILHKSDMFSPSQPFNFSTRSTFGDLVVNEIRVWNCGSDVKCLNWMNPALPCWWLRGTWALFLQITYRL